MSTHSTDTRELREDENEAEADAGSRAKRAVSTVASFNENGTLTAVLGGALLVRGVRSLSRGRGRGRALLQGVAGAALLAFGLRQRRSGSEDASDGTKEEDVSDEARAHREQSKVLGQSETNPRGTSGEPEVERERHEGNVEFTEEQDIEPSHQPDLEDETGVEDPRRDHGDETEIDLSEAAMADEASEATGPSSEQAQPAETEGTEPEPTAEEDASEADSDAFSGEGGGETGGADEPDPDADPGEATREAAEAEPANVADEIIEDETDEEDREGVVTEGGAKVHTDTNESDMMDIDEDDVTDPDDELNEEPPDSENQSSSHLVDEDDEEREE